MQAEEPNSEPTTAGPVIAQLLLNVALVTGLHVGLGWASPPWVSIGIVLGVFGLLVFTKNSVIERQVVLVIVMALLCIWGAMSGPSLATLTPTG